MSDFWSELEEQSKDLDLKKLAVQDPYKIAPVKDYYVRVKTWEFKKVGKNDTPLCECKLEIIAPVDGINLEEVKGMTIQQNLWLTQPKEPGKLGGIGMSLKIMSIMSGEPVDSVKKISSAKLDTNVFKITKNKQGEYNGNPQFDIGFSNAMTKTDYIDLKDMGISIDGESGSNNTGFDDGPDNYNDEDMAF